MQVEYVWCFLQAKDESDVVVEGALPVTAEEMPILWANRYMAESILEIQLREKCAGPKMGECGDGLLKGLVSNVSLRITDAIVNGGALRPGEVVDDTLFARPAFARHCPEGGAAEVGMRRGGEGSVYALVFEESGNISANRQGVLKGRLEVCAGLRMLRRGEADAGTKFNYVQQRTYKEPIGVV